LKRAEFAEVLSKSGVKFKISARILGQKSTYISFNLCSVYVKFAVKLQLAYDLG